MREQTLEYVPLIWNGGDTLPKVEDTIYTDTDQIKTLDLTDSTVTLWLFSYDNVVDFDSPLVSGTATIVTPTTGAVSYTFTSGQTTTLSSQDISLFTAFWKVHFTDNNVLRIRIPTPFRFLKVT